MSISTLEILEQAQMPAAHARAIAKAIEVDFTHRLDNLVTKADLASLRAEMATKADFVSLEGKFASLDGKFGDLRVGWPK